MRKKQSDSLLASRFNMSDMSPLFNCSRTEFKVIIVNVSVLSPFLAVFLKNICSISPLEHPYKNMLNFFNHRLNLILPPV